MVPLRMIEPINPINSRFLNNLIQENPQEDPQEVVEMTPIEEVVEMVEDHMIITEGEIEEIEIRRTPL